MNRIKTKPKGSFCVGVSLALGISFALSLFAREIPQAQDEYDPAKWPFVELTLSQSGTLTNIFDSGLRPYRHPGLETSTLQVKHFILSLKLGSGKKLPNIFCEFLNIRLFPNGELARLEGRAPAMMLNEARTELTRWAAYDEKGLTTEQIEQFFRGVSGNSMSFVAMDERLARMGSVFWAEPGWGQVGGGPRCAATFVSVPSDTHPLVFSFVLSWGANRARMESTIFDSPIPPPPGYEHVNMTAPASFGPDSMVGKLRAQGVKIGGDDEARQRLFAGKAAPTSPLPPINEVVVENKPERARFGTLSLWLVLGLVVIGIFYRLRKPG